MQTVLEMVGISKSFPGVRALDKMNFDLYKGEVHALVGENGAGKSTLMKVLSGLYTADEGEVRLHGKKIESAGIRQMIDAGRKRHLPGAQPHSAPLGGREYLSSAASPGSQGSSSTGRRCTGMSRPFSSPST
jgi:ABC-type multidrug transport system ATPase subunit